MKRILRSLLVLGLLAGFFALCAPSSKAGIFRRGWRGGYVGGPVYGPGAGYRVYRPAGYGWGGYGPGYRRYGWGYGGYGMGYPVYGAGYPGYGVGMYGGGYPGYGWSYPGVYGGTSVSIGSPMSGFNMSTYPY
jgi:hypothetical protein